MVAPFFLKRRTVRTIKKIFNTTVSVKEGASRSVLRGIVQYDTLNEVNIRLTDGSKAFDYYGYTNIVFKVLKADGTSYVDSEGENVIATSPEDGIVTVILKGQATTAAGLCQSVIEIYNGAEKMTTARLNYEVFEKLDTAEETDSESQYPVFQNLMNDLSALEASIEEAEAKRVAAETARVALETGYVAQAQKAAVASSVSAAEAKKWAEQTKDVVSGDFATRTELNAVRNTKTISDWNDAHSNGWYSGGAGAANSPDSKFTWFGRVSALTDEVCIQEVWGMVDTNVYRHCVRLVYPNSGTPWEWVNPPMLLNVEYRTTERYLGKPVYAKVVDFGALPNNTQKILNHGITTLKQAIRCDLIASTGAYITNDSSVAYCVANTGAILVKTTVDYSSVTANVILKYTKTTDD